MYTISWIKSVAITNGGGFESNPVPYPNIPLFIDTRIFLSGSSGKHRTVYMEIFAPI